MQELSTILCILDDSPFVIQNWNNLFRMSAKFNKKHDKSDFPTFFNFEFLNFF